MYIGKAILFTYYKPVGDVARNGCAAHVPQRNAVIDYSKYLAASDAARILQDLKTLFLSFTAVVRTTLKERQKCARPIANSCDGVQGIQ